MSVTAVEMIREEIGFSDGTWSGTRVYRVDVDSLADDALDAYSADDGSTAVPDVGDYWSGGNPAKVKGKRVTHFQDDQLTYEVTVDYSSAAGAQSDAIEDPLSRPVQFSYGDTAVTEPYFRDTDDLPVVNSAGQDFQDLPERDRALGTISITRNVSSYSDATAQGFRDKVNTSSATLNGTPYDARTLRIVSWSATGPHEENDIEFWTETINFAHRPETWDHEFEDRGFGELDGAGSVKPILDAKNEPVQQPWPLDGAGAAKANATDTPETITRKPYTGVSFASI